MSFFKFGKERLEYRKCGFFNLGFQKTRTKKRFNLFLFFLFLFFFLPFYQVKAVEPSLSLSPASGSFFVGSTFSVSIILDTKKEKINVIDVGLEFPPDILQVASPATGESFISEWSAPPSYSNIGGTVSFKGGIPQGIATSAGLVSTVSFRARSAGVARIEVSDSSQVFLHDGKGTPVLTKNFGGVYEILVLPFEGPRIFSASHPDSDIWYPDSAPSFSWEKDERVTDFSYLLSQNPTEIPNTVSDGDDNFKSYQDLSDGIWYFHLRSKKDGTWGRTSHFQIKIDTTPPRILEIDLDVYSGFVYFEAQDDHSGVDYYEISFSKIDEESSSAPFFIEAESPFKNPYREAGKYKVFVRAYDRAGNYRQEEMTFRMISPFLSYVEGKGVEVKGFLIYWQYIYFILILVLATASYLFYRSTKIKSYDKGIKEIREALREIDRIRAKEAEAEETRSRFEEEKRRFQDELK